MNKRNALAAPHAATEEPLDAISEGGRKPQRRALQSTSQDISNETTEPRAASIGVLEGRLNTNEACREPCHRSLELHSTAPTQDNALHVTDGAARDMHNPDLPNVTRVYAWAVFHSNKISNADKHGMDFYRAAGEDLKTRQGEQFGRSRVDPCFQFLFAAGLVKPNEDGWISAAVATNKSGAQIVDEFKKWRRRSFISDVFKLDRAPHDLVDGPGRRRPNLIVSEAQRGPQRLRVLESDGKSRGPDPVGTANPKPTPRIVLSVPDREAKALRERADHLAEMAAARARFETATRAPRTREVYDGLFSRFRAWCDRFERCSMPASSETIGLYIADLLEQGRRTAHCEVVLAAIRYHHRRERAAEPCGAEIRRMIGGAKRVRLERPQRKFALTLDHVRQMCRHLAVNKEPRNARDRAVILVGFAGGMRRSEVAALDLADLDFVQQGVLMRLTKSKTDQDGSKGQLVALPYGKYPDTCPVMALEDWLSYRGSAAGPLFSPVRQTKTGYVPMDKRLCDDAVNQIVKRAIVAIGLDIGKYSAHSMRAGFVTEAAAAGATDLMISQQTHHATMAVLKEYLRPQNAWKGNAVHLLDL